MFSLGGIPSGLYFRALILHLQFYNFNFTTSHLEVVGRRMAYSVFSGKNMKAATGLNRGLGLQDLECVSVS